MISPRPCLAADSHLRAYNLSYLVSSSYGHLLFKV